jgi:hypothetical protein
MPKFLKKTYFIQDVTEKLKSEIEAAKRDNPMLQKYSSLEILKIKHEEHSNKALNANRKKHQSFRDRHAFNIDLSKKHYRGRRADLHAAEARLSNARENHSELLSHELFGHLPDLERDYTQLQLKFKVTEKESAITRLTELYYSQAKKTLSAEDISLIKHVVDAYFLKHSVKDFLESINMSNGKLLKKKVYRQADVNLLRAAVEYTQKFITLDYSKARKNPWCMQEYFLLKKIHDAESVYNDKDFLSETIKLVGNKSEKELLTTGQKLYYYFYFSNRDYKYFYNKELVRVRKDQRLSGDLFNICTILVYSAPILNYILDFDIPFSARYFHDNGTNFIDLYLLSNIYFVFENLSYRNVSDRRNNFEQQSMVKVYSIAMMITCFFSVLADSDLVPYENRLYLVLACALDLYVLMVLDNAKLASSRAISFFQDKSQERGEVIGKLSKITVCEDEKITAFDNFFSEHHKICKDESQLEACFSPASSP